MIRQVFWTWVLWLLLIGMVSLLVSLLFTEVGRISFQTAAIVAIILTALTLLENGRTQHDAH